MKLEIIQIGSARGIRIPEPLLDQYGFGDSAELIIEEDHFVISPSRTPRRGWAAALEAEKPSVDDALLLDLASGNRFDQDEWTW